MPGYSRGKIFLGFGRQIGGILAVMLWKVFEKSSLASTMVMMITIFFFLGNFLKENKNDVLCLEFSKGE